MKSACLYLFVFLLALSARAVPEAERLKSIYEKQLSRLTSEAQAELLRAPQDHIAAMRELEMSYQQSGELKSLLAVRNERERFIGNPRADAIVPATTPDRLRTLQEAYISRGREISEKRTIDVRDLRSKYLQALENLQKSLTRQGKIESALVVMNEVEALKRETSENGNTGGGGHDPQRVDSNSPRMSSDALDLAALGELLNGKVTRWNSYSRQITITYDFSSAQQIEDWKGGTLDTTRGVLVCTRTVAWVRPQFLQVLEIGYDVLFDGYELMAGMTLGNSLQAHLIGGDALQAKLFQSSEEHPICDFTEANGVSQRVHRSELMFQSGRIEWSVDRTRVRRSSLEAPIRYPTYVGFGHMGATSGYDNITITGILSKEYIAYLMQQL
jgi:hypothetical protein